MLRWMRALQRRPAAAMRRRKESDLATRMVQAMGGKVRQTIPPTAPPPPPVDHSLLGRLRQGRNAKLNELAKLNSELLELDAQISWLERFPQVEAIIRSLMGR
jgi:hypothetical protein